MEVTQAIIPEIPWITVPTWVDDCCAMRSPVMESGRSGGTTNIIALSRVPGNPVWADDPCVITNLYRRYQSKSISNSTNT